MREQNLAPETCVLQQAHTQLLGEDDLLVAFRRRCMARVAAVRSGKMQLLDAVDALQAVAEQEGLIREFGQDEIQRILSEVFGALRSEPPHA
jgi:hypothetical protein